MALGSAKYGDTTPSDLPTELTAHAVPGAVPFPEFLTGKSK
jgi:hypothetical protein